MNRRRLLVLILLVDVTLFFWNRLPVQKRADTATPIVNEKSNSFECPYEELKLYNEFGETVSNIIKKDCLLASVTKLSNSKILIDGIGYGCVSCHANMLYIIKNNALIFKYDGDDSRFSETNGGFQIREPIRKDGEPMCCATEYVIKKYQYIEAQNIVKKLESETYNK